MGRPFCRRFDGIVGDGTGRASDGARANAHGDEEVGPVAAAFFHARFMRETAMEVAPDPNPDGSGGVIGYLWATALTRVDLR